MALFFGIVEFVYNESAIVHLQGSGHEGIVAIIWKEGGITQRLCGCIAFLINWGYLDKLKVISKNI